MENEIIQVLAEAIDEKSRWELIAVLLGIAYLVFAMKESVWCWLCALVSTAIYIWLFWNVSLLMESALNLYYLLMAVYGYWVWSSRKGSGENKPICSWPVSSHISAIIVILALTFISGTFLTYYSSAAWPYLDSFTTWGAVVTTYMVAQKVLENWIYWFLIDGLSIFLYLDKALYFTAALFVLYLVLVIFGFFSWKKTFAMQSYADTSQAKICT